MIHNMDLYQVFYFTAKTGSLSKAAEELFITQPAVTHAIKQLESKLGGQLFIRTSKGVTLTAEGSMLFTYIEQAYHFIHEGERKIGEMHELISGEVKIGAGDTLCKHYLLPHLKAYHESFPSIKIQVINRTTAETISLLKEGKIDLGIVNLPLSDPNIEIQEGMTIHDCFIAGEGYKQLSETAISLEQLLTYPLVLLEEGSRTRAYLDEIASEQGLTIKPEIELGSVDLLIEFARSGFGIACVIKEFITQELIGNSLYEIQLQNPLPPRKIGIIKRKRTPLSFAAAHLHNMLLQT
ncbi:LysR family transcriptional regulator [Paenibacillus marinisediminis]